MVGSEHNQAGENAEHTPVDSALTPPGTKMKPRNPSLQHSRRVKRLEIRPCVRLKKIIAK